MATLTPSQLPTLREDGGLFRELDVLERLRLGLPDGFEIFHEVTWHTIHEGLDRHGEIDIVVLSPAGDMLLMEVKAGSVLLREGGIFKRCNDNHRSPRSVCQVINALALASPAIISKSPYQGEFPEFLHYDSEFELIKQTECAVVNLLEQGYALSDIVVLTGHGRNKSKLLNADRIGRFTTRRFTGAYTRNGDPVWSEGELMVESIYRFKGQSAPAVILSEVDFTELTDQERRKLFVGMTRAQLNLQIVLSSQAEACFADVLG